ncbi:MAG: MFS transporter [Nitrososphaeria archaeon]
MKSNYNFHILSVLSVTTLASFLTGLNARLAVVGLPVIAHELSADIDTVLWIIQGFMLGSTIIQLIVGRLSDLFGRVRLFNWGFLIFITAAIIAGAAPNPILLVFARIIQGVGGAFLMTLSITILTDNVPKNRLGTWLGINQVAWRVGAVAGLSLSGLIIDLWGWRWLYLFYVPLGFGFYIWSTRKLKEVYKPSVKPYIDKVGFATFTGFLSSLLVALSLFTFGPSYVNLAYILLIVSIVFLVAFVFWENKIPWPALDLSLFKIWQFTGGIISQSLYAIGFGASTTLLVLYLEVVKGFSATLTGFLLIPFELSYLVFGVLGGRLSDRYGYVKIAFIGLLASSLAFLGLSTIVPETEINFIIFCQLLFGFGAGLFIAPNTSSIMSAAPLDKRGVASALRTISFNIGFVLSLNVAIISMVQFIPYDVASKLIMAEGLVSDSGGYSLSDLCNALAKSFLLQSIAMASAIPFTILRSKSKVLDLEKFKLI